MKVFRNELKYYISRTDHMLLRRLLSAALGKDAFSEKKSYAVKSVYFDSVNNKSFYEKMYGLKDRKKYRLRVYDSGSAQVKFEIKNKLNDMTYKKTALISKKDALRVIDGDYDVLLKYRDDVLDEIYCTFKKELMRPVALISYFREAFLYGPSRVRITFDSGLSCDDDFKGLFEEVKQKRRLLDGGTTIMEVKFDRFLPGWISDLLSTVPSTRSAISKYCISREGGFE